MPVARVHKNINLFIDGRGYAGRVTEFDPPKLTIKTEDFRAGGMDAPRRIDMGMEPMESMVTLADVDRDALKLFGLVKGEDAAMTLRGGQEGPGTGVEAVVHQLRGRITEVDWGTWKPGDVSPVKLKMDLGYYKLEVDGETDIEIDVDNMVRIIDGEDQLAEMREALGI
ncbi:MAG: phage major tail tube protein [Bryobacterales bacterium]|nr:phage major tail tube protein [Bryobacterales bacterium]